MAAVPLWYNNGRIDTRMGLFNCSLNAWRAAMYKNGEERLLRDLFFLHSFSVRVTVPSAQLCSCSLNYSVEQNINKGLQGNGWSMIIIYCLAFKSCLIQSRYVFIVLRPTICRRQMHLNNPCIFVIMLFIYAEHSFPLIHQQTVRSCWVSSRYKAKV